MDYPGDSVLARAPTLVNLSRAKNGFWFRRFLAEIFFVKCRQKINRAFRCLHMWWDEFGCPLHVIRSGVLAALFRAGMVAPVMWLSLKRRCLFLDCTFVFAFV